MTHDLLNEEEKLGEEEREDDKFLWINAATSVGWMSISQMNVQGLMESEMCVMDGAKSMLKDNIVYHIIFMLKKKKKKKTWLVLVWWTLQCWLG